MSHCDTYIYTCMTHLQQVCFCRVVPHSHLVPSADGECFFSCLRYMMTVCRAEIEGMMAIVVKGDAMSPDDLEKAFDGIEDVDAVVSTIGGTPADPSSDSQVLQSESLGFQSLQCNILAFLV